MAAALPERRTAMHHIHLDMGAVMVDADGWRLPLNYGDTAREAGWLRETVGICDVSPIGKVRVVGGDAALAVTTLASLPVEEQVGLVVEADSPLEGGGKLLAACLASDEYLILTPPGRARPAIAWMRSAPADCAHAVDVTSGLCGVSLVGPATREVLSRVTEVDISSARLPDLRCVQSRFAEIQALLIRRDVNDIPIYQLYAGREFGEYLWEVLVDAAGEVGGGPVGTEAMSGLKG